MKTPPPTQEAKAGYRAALLGRCPACGASGLFSGPVRFADRCSHCGLDYGQFNVGDGPAAFLTLIIGALVVAGALTLELTVEPPFWVHIILWVPATVVAVLFGLRAGKGVLLHAEYHRSAGQGRLADPVNEAAPPVDPAG